MLCTKCTKLVKLSFNDFFYQHTNYFMKAAKGEGTDAEVERKELLSSAFLVISLPARMMLE
jgi:hypothetical protein